MRNRTSASKRSVPNSRSLASGASPPRGRSSPAPGSRQAHAAKDGARTKAAKDGARTKKEGRQSASAMKAMLRKAAARRKAIVAAYLADDSLTKADVARKFGVSRERVRQILAREGVPTHRKLKICIVCSARFPGRYAVKTCSPACADKRARSVRELQIAHGRAAGRHQSRARQDIADLRRQGLGYAAIAAKLGVHASTVAHHLRRANLVGLWGSWATSPKRQKRLRDRERLALRVCKLFESGLTAREVAARLGMSVETVKLHVADRHYREQPKPRRGK